MKGTDWFGINSAVQLLPLGCQVLFSGQRTWQSLDPMGRWGCLSHLFCQADISNTTHPHWPHTWAWHTPHHPVMPGIRRGRMQPLQRQEGNTGSSSQPLSPCCCFLANCQPSQTTSKAGLSSRLFLGRHHLETLGQWEQGLAAAFGFRIVLNPRFCIPGWQWRTAHSILSEEGQMCKHYHKVWAFKDEQVTLKLFPNAKIHRKCCLAPSEGKNSSGKEGAMELAGW